MCVENFRSLFFLCKKKKKHKRDIALSLSLVYVHFWDILWFLFFHVLFIHTCYTPMRTLLYLALEIIRLVLKWQQQLYFQIHLFFAKKKVFLPRSKQLIPKGKWWNIKHKNETIRVLKTYTPIGIPCLTIRYHSMVQSPKYTKHAFLLFSFIDIMSSGSFLLIYSFLPFIVYVLADLIFFIGSQYSFHIYWMP